MGRRKLNTLEDLRRPRRDPPFCPAWSEDAHLMVGAKDRKAGSRFSDSAGTSCARGSSAAHGLRVV